MKVLPKAKQLRFAQLVKSSGKPYSATLWTEPGKDPEFEKAMEQNRVVTVRNVNVGTKKDRGIIGFLKGPNSTFLIFPRSLPMPEGTGVIGLKFEDLADAPVDDPVRVKAAPRKKKVEKVKTIKEPPKKSDPETGFPEKTKGKKPTATTKKEEKKGPAEKTFRFRVKVSFSATVLRDIEVEATGASAAIAAAERKAHEDPPTDVNWKVEGLEVKSLR